MLYLILLAVVFVIFFVLALMAYFNTSVSFVKNIRGLLGLEEKPATADQQEETLRLLQEIKGSIANPPEGTSEIDTRELARAGGPDTPTFLREALDLQRQNKEGEAIDALYEAFRRDLEPTAKAQLHNLTGTSFLNLSQLEEAEGHYRQALTVSLDAGDEKGQADAYGNLALIFDEKGQTDGAEEMHKRALELSRTAGDRKGEADHLSNLGVLYARRGNNGQAEGLFKEAMDIDREIDNGLGEGQELANLALLYRKQDKPEQSVDHAEQALAISREFGNRILEANSLSALGLAYRSLKKPSRSEAYTRESLDIHREIGHRLGEGAQLGNLGGLSADRGDLTSAANFFSESLGVYKKIGYKLGQANQLGNLGFLAAGSDPDRACQLLKEALSIFNQIGAVGPEAHKTRSKLEELGCEEEAREPPASEHAPTG